MSQRPGRKEQQGAGVPTAFYPPSAPSNTTETDGTQNVKSALSPSPFFPQQQQYSSSTFRRDASQGTTKSKTSSRQAAGAFTPSSTANAQVLFCPAQPDVYACINCVNTTTETTEIPQQERGKRSGPVLLELRRLHLRSPTSVDGSLFDSTTLAISQGNPSLGTSVASTCMAFSDSAIVDYTTTPDSTAAIPPCATGLSTGALCIHSFSSHQNANVTYFATRHQRPASAVAWRPGTNNSQVAIGLVSSSSSSTSGASSHYRPRGPRSSGGSGGGGDREFSCLLWDVTKGTTTAPISKLSHNVGVASLAWLAEGKTLCIGSQLRHFHLYDLRMSGTTAAPTGTWAHSEAVNGIVVDSFRKELLATFGKTAGEAVKLWDVRRLDTCVGEIKTASGSIVSGIEFSKLHPGMLSVAVGDVVQAYDTTASTSRPVLAQQSSAASNILDFCLYPQRKRRESDVPMDEARNEEVMKELCQNRMLVVLADKSVQDMPTNTTAPLAISRRDGRLAHAFGGALWVNSSTDGPSAMENSTFQADEDISSRMMRRAKCSNKTRYSMDAALNLEMFSHEEDIVIANEEKVLNGSLPSIRSMIGLWSWIERIERFCWQREAYGVEKWPAKGLADSGAWHLLQMDRPASDDGAVNDVVRSDSFLSIETYDSPARSLAFSACGWAGSESLEDVQAICEEAGEFERSAALAVWHGDIGAAVEALQRGSEVIQDLQGVEGLHMPNFPPQYAETLQLVSMCIAGYRGSDPTASWSSVWRKACLNLLKRDDLSGDNLKKDRVAYLRSMCTFLVSIGTENSLKCVLHDEQLSVGDRVALACRFLDHAELRRYLDGCVSYCQASGNLEGLVVTGLDKRGIQILQAYVDKYADVQTAALVCSRAIFTGEWERSISLQWLDAYRALLNSWQMWSSRAMFDVDVAEYLSKLKARQDGGLHGGRIINHQNRRMVHPSIPAQLDARCNKCSKSLTGFRGRQDGAAPQRLAKANPKPVLSCCPHCLNALPRCSICLLSLGCLNPYMEAKKERANLPIAEWFTWCMRCKHGGHAHHLVGWFASHSVCPVSGCECKCQFDAMQKLHRQVNGNDSTEIKEIQTEEGS